MNADRRGLVLGLLVFIALAGCQGTQPVRNRLADWSMGAVKQAAAEQRMRETHPADEFPFDAADGVALKNSG